MDCDTEQDNGCHGGLMDYVSALLLFLFLFCTLCLEGTSVPSRQSRSTQALQRLVPAWLHMSLSQTMSVRVCLWTGNAFKERKEVRVARE